MRENSPIISEAHRHSVETRIATRVLLGALLIGGLGALFYARHDLTLSHYDARAHLLVARRILDSLTPGWRQIGAVWLPLPHLVAMLPVQWDWAYRTGYPIVVISIAILAAGLAGLSAYLYKLTGSRWAAAIAPALILLNPNVLYLQSTPMTEALLIGFMLLALLSVHAWTVDATPARTHRAGLLLAALMWTRYEGWCVAIGLILIATWSRLRARASLPWGLAGYACAAVTLFMLLSWTSTGHWFVSSGFFVPDNPALHRPLVAFAQVVRALTDLGSPAVLIIAAVGLGLIVWQLLQGQWSPAPLPLALVAAAALPWFAFFSGHPLRVRYMVPLIPATAVLSAIAIARIGGRWQPLGAMLLVGLACIERPPLDLTAPMVQEAQWETPFRLKREEVTRQFLPIYDDTPILASMGSLGHYMQESSHAGLALKNFLHEGNGDLWQAALQFPRRHVRWILMEERAEGGDMLAALSRSRPDFLQGFSRTAEGGGLVLYRRDDR